MKPRVAITVGDPAGIGPEVAARAAADPRVLAACDPLSYGPPAGGVFAKPGLHLVAHQDANDCLVTRGLGANAHCICHVLLLSILTRHIHPT